MRIAIFTESYEPVVNGVSVAVATLRDGLKAHGHEVHVFAPRFRGYKDAECVYRFPSRVSRLAKGYPLPIPFAPKLRDEFLALRPDIVHTQSPFLLGVTGLKWAKLAGVPIVSTNHTLYTEYTHYLPFLPQSMTKSMIVSVMQWYYERCSAVVVPSHPVEQVLRHYGIDTRIEVIQSGVSNIRSYDREESRRFFDVPPDAYLLLYVGRVAREKNLGLLLRSFKSIRSKYPKARLMIVGSGPYESACRVLAKTLRVDNSITFMGMLKRDDVWRAYCAADTFVFPSVTETQGLVLSEALTAGLPCVAVRASGTPDVIENEVDGFLTDNSVSSFTGPVCRLISDQTLRAQLSKSAVKESARFTVDVMIDKFVKFYQSVL
ncbi:MAG: glycosyltransferase [Armatimonadota bacterium]